MKCKTRDNFEYIIIYNLKSSNFFVKKPNAVFYFYIRSQFH